jgi:hypothetical protein
MEKKIEEMTLEELKSLCYDQIVILQRTQNNVNILQAEINKRYEEKENVPGKKS